MSDKIIFLLKEFNLFNLIIELETSTHSYHWFSTFKQTSTDNEVWLNMFIWLNNSR